MSVKRYEWMACDEHACHCDVVESAEGDMVDYEDYAALEARCAALAAENAGLKSEVPMGAIENGRAFADRLEAYPFECQGGNLNMCSDWQELRRCFEHLSEWAMHGQPETPATDAFLAEVRAQGVEQLASLAGNECQRYKSVNDRSGARKWKSIVILCTDFAAQLRKGVQS